MLCYILHASVWLNTLLHAVFSWLQSISRTWAGRTGHIFAALSTLTKLFTGQPQRPDLEAIVACGLFEESASSVAAITEAGGVDGPDDVNVYGLTQALGLLRQCHLHPGTEARLRSLAPALAWCLEHDLDVMEQCGVTTGAYAAQLCMSTHPRSHAARVCADHVRVRRLCRLRTGRRQLRVFIHTTTR